MALATKLGMSPVMYPTIKALALLDLGRYDAAWESLQQEIADEHCQLGRALKEFGEGMRFLELMAYGKARSVFESVIGQAKQLGRAWLLPWAEAGLAKSLVQSQRLDELNLDWINQDLARTSTTLPAAAPQLLGEIALQERKLDEALRQAEKAGTEAEARDWKPSYVAALELQLRALLLLDRPEDVISLADKGIRMAEEMEYRPLLWRVRLAKAQALAALGARAAAAQEYKASAAVIRALANTIDDAQLKRGFMSNTSVSMALERG
jgi:tetratricopeptide (TPR) repeat protein